jgi:predicted porin
MFGGLLKSTSRLALVAAAATVVGGVSAQAADLGGNCCADLEERVAELEATTARKGNRKVSLTVYGQVNKAMIWHDSDRFDAYRPEQVTIRDNDASMSRFGFRGSANLNADWSVSYNIEVGVQENFGRSTSVLGGANDDQAQFLIRHNVVRFTSKTFGTFGIGQTSTASDGAFEVNLANVQGITPIQSDALELMLGTAYSGFASPFDGTRRQGLYYSSPTFAGFAFSAGWGHKDQDRNKANDTTRCVTNQATFECDTDEFFDLALRYAGEFNGVRLAAAIAYRQENDTVDPTVANGVGRDAEVWMGSGSIMHVPTGLFLSGGYGDFDSDTASRSVQGWWGILGIQQNWFGIGTTTLHAEYGTMDYKASTGQVGDVALGLNDNARRDGDYWGVGLTQNLSAAATDLYINYRKYSIDGTGSAAATQQDAEANVITAGAIVRF